jgi:hypothetical protein
MARKSRLRELEAQEGRPAGDVVIDLYKQHGSLEKVAGHLGVTQSTLSVWLLKLGLEVRSVLVAKEGQ